jgi:2-(1,2-epoxy-1,2-dihydrophenyl)acetyl-CoA isomerase
MSDLPVLLDIDAGIATITLNRPKRLNALSSELTPALQAAIDQVAADRAVRCVILTGSGRGFCAGADLADIQPFYERGENPDLGRFLREAYNPLILPLVRMEKPVIAAVNGIAAGAGASLALACDVVIASEDASFFQAFVKVGLIPDSGAHFLLPHLVGYRKALELAMTGDLVSATDAQRIGLINAVVPSDELLERVRKDWAEPFATGPTRAYALMKQAMRFGATHTLEEVLDYEADLQSQISLTADHREGVMAFLEKRAAKFEGK